MDSYIPIISSKIQSRLNLFNLGRVRKKIKINLTLINTIDGYKYISIFIPCFKKSFALYDIQNNKFISYPNYGFKTLGYKKYVVVNSVSFVISDTPISKNIFVKNPLI